MIITACIIALLGSAQDFAIPAEASSEYRKIALDIENAFVEKNFAAGSKLLAKLPGSDVTYRFEASKATPAQKEAFKAAIVGAANSWQTALGSAVTFKATDSVAADILFRFDSVDLWQWSLKSPTLQLNAGFGVKQAARDAKFTFAKYLGLGTGRTITPDLAIVRKLVNLSSFLRGSIADMAPDYRVPVGASSEFHHLVIDIENALTSKNYGEAEKLGKLLPRSTMTWSFDTSKLNADQKAEFSQVVSSAETNWQNIVGSLVEFKHVAVGKSDVAISFEPVLSKISGTSEVAGAAYFLGVDSTQARVESVIGLKRGPALAKVVGREVYNECLFTFGRYLGLAPSPLLGSAMGRVEGQMANANIVSIQEATAVRKVFKLSNQLRDAIRDKITIAVSHPIISIDRDTMVFSEQFQGDEGRVQALVTNAGSSPLELELKGDCGCISGDVVPVLAPGKSTILTGKFSTAELVGDVHHNLILKTNDPDRPMIIIPASITVNARAEVVYPESNTAYMDGPDRNFVFYINSVESKLFKIIDSTVVGLPFTVKVELYDGEQTNFIKFGQKQKIHGYKVTVDTSKMPNGLPGRSNATVYFRTDNPKLPIVRAQMFVQKGIVSLPEAVYLGSPQGVADSTFVLVRLGRPFKVIKVTSDSKFLTFEVKPNEAKNPSVFTIRVIYDGKAEGHRLHGTITVVTDDAKQPIIKLPYQTSQT